MMQGKVAVCDENKTHCLVPLERKAVKLSFKVLHTGIKIVLKVCSFSVGTGQGKVVLRKCNYGG